MVEAFIPKDLDECLRILSERKVRIVAGGTDMLIQNRSHTGMSIGYRNDVLYINNLNELKNIYEDDAFVYIGAALSLEKIMQSDIVPKLLKDTILEMASPAIRHTATLAGNIGNASPAGDSLVSLYLMDAELEIRSINNTRRVFLKDFIKGVRKIALESDELITKVIIPKLVFEKAYFKKVGPRLSDAISKLSFAGAYQTYNNRITDIRIAFGAVNITVVRDRVLEKKLLGKKVEEIKEMMDLIISWYDPLILPIDDQRSNKVYRKEVSFNLLREFVRNLN
ncbi:MAG: FAD binding domain-containing protein [Candidatus Izemoplasmatales bacterium]|nr:FAD binding domain-containing protein [Candidatus Izemoplasmatales bacterium]